MSVIAKLPGRFVETTIDDEVIVMELGGGEFFSLTGTAAEIWRLIDGGRSRKAILAELSVDRDAPGEVIASDLDAFLQQLVKAGFVTHGG